NFPSATFPSGMTTWQRSPAAAAYAAAEAEVLPVEAQMIDFAPCSLALATAMTMPRSLKEPVGFIPSNLSQSSSHPSARASDGAAISGVSPSPSVSAGVAAVMGKSSPQRRSTPSRMAVLVGRVDADARQYGSRAGELG